jgi:hypothetical protein
VACGLLIADSCNSAGNMTCEPIVGWKLSQLSRIRILRNEFSCGSVVAKGNCACSDACQASGN